MTHFIGVSFVSLLFAIGLASAQDLYPLVPEAARKAVSRKGTSRLVVIVKGDEALTLGQKLFKDQDYPAATLAFHDALALYPEIPICQPRREEALTSYLAALGAALSGAQVQREDLKGEDAVVSLPDLSSYLPELTAALRMLYPVVPIEDR